MIFSVNGSNSCNAFEVPTQKCPSLSINNDFNSTRKSYNISHKSIYVLSLPKEIEKLFNLKIKDIFNGFENKKFDDMSIGIDKHGENFITFYFEEEKIIYYLKKLNII